MECFVFIHPPTSWPQVAPLISAFQELFRDYRGIPYLTCSSAEFVGPMIQCMAMEPEVDAPLALSIPAGYVLAIVDKQEGRRLPAGFVQ